MIIEREDIKLRYHGLDIVRSTGSPQVGDLPVILVELNTSVSSVPSVAKTYIYANSQILAQYDGDWRMPLDCKNFYLHDRLGSVRQIMDCQAGVAALYTYNPFGETIESDGTFSNPFRFTGQWYDEEINWYYLRARMYDPHLSRFTGRDPILGKFEEPLTLHKYLYCRNNPILMVDPDGLFAMYLTGFLQAHCYWGKTIQRGLVIDDDWNVGIITTKSEGWGAPTAGFGINLGFSYDADTIYDLAGEGWSSGASYSFGGLNLGFGGFMNDEGDVSGYELSVGGSIPTPWPGSYFMSTSTTVERFPDYGAIDMIGDISTVTSMHYRLWQRDMRQQLREMNEMFFSLDYLSSIKSQGEAYRFYFMYGAFSMLTGQ